MTAPRSSHAARPIRIRDHIVRAIHAAGLLALCAACAANRRAATSAPALANDALALAAADRTLRDSVVERLARRVERRGDRTLDLLYLSGGGANGAFGAGFLRGWLSRPGGPAPVFDLVTGVSTGALQAPFALIGTEESIDTLAALYRDAINRVAPSIDWLFWLRRTGGVVNTAKFEQTLTAHVTGAMNAELQKAFDADRQLLISTADMDLGIGRIWSMSDIIDSTASALETTRGLLKSATAIPGIFPPVMIDGHLHADGGVINNLLSPLSETDYQRLAARLTQRGIPGVTIRVWAVINLWMHAPVQVVPASNRGKIEDRMLALLFYAQQPQTVESLSRLASAVSRESGLRVEFRFTSIPQDMANDPGSTKLFDNAFIQRLEQAGFAKARSSVPWDSLPSAWARPPR